jgi:16S rRNA (guanine1207-N2)-methyltransferase
MSDSSAYRQTRILQAALAGRQLAIASRPALDAGVGPTPADELLARQAMLRPGERILVSPCGRGAVAAWAASVLGPLAVVALDTNAIALELTQLTLVANGLDGVAVQSGLPTPNDGPFDRALLSIPKGRRLSRLHVLSAALALRPGGHLYVAGANNEGIKSVLVDCERLLGPGELLAYRKGHRVARFTRGSLDIAALPPPFDAAGLLPGSFMAYQVSVGGQRVPLCSRPGVFSHGELDDGTAMLLANLAPQPGDRVFDLGCGVGIIGIVAALAVGAPQVTLLDVDALACESASASLAANHLVGAHVIQGDGLAGIAPASYDLILSNPPFHAGHAVNLAITAALIEEAHQALAAEGRLVLVANRFLPYDRLIQARFGEVATLAADGRFRVLAATRRSRR